MTDSQKIIEKAKRGGWDYPPGLDVVYDFEGRQITHDILPYIFDHDFLKAYFGEKGWQYHGQQLVLAKDRKEYLKQFLPGIPEKSKNP